MILLLVVSLIAQAGTLAPVSDAQRAPGFSRYLSKLKAAIGKRDSKALQKLVDSSVIVGGFADKDERGWNQLVQRWQLNREDSELWDILADFIELGFFREAPDTLVTPYLAWKFPRELDPSEHLVVLRDALPLRATPDRNGRVVATLAFDIVRQIGASQQGGFGWVEVETANGIRGFVQSANVRSPLMARAQFGRKDGQWLLVALDRGRDH